MIDGHAVAVARQQMKRSQSIFASVRSPVVVSDEEGTVLEVNQDVLKLFGYTEVRLGLAPKGHHNAIN